MLKVFAMNDIETIYKKYSAKVFRLALSIVKNEKDAQDIMQNVFFKIIKKIDTLRNQTYLATWIYRITYNEALIYLRKKSRTPEPTAKLGQKLKNQQPAFFINFMV